MKKRAILYSIMLCGTVVSAIGFLIMWHINNLREVSVIFLDVGQGDAILIMQGTHQVLIDGGADGAILQEQLGKYMPFWDREIDIVIATHPDSDHIDGLIDVFKNYAVHQFWHTSAFKDTSQYAALMNAAQSEINLDDVLVRYGVRAYVDDGVYLQVVYPYKRNLGDVKDSNDTSIAIMLYVYDDIFYMGGDLSSSHEDSLPIGQVTVLKVGHHGSKESTSEHFLRKLRPRDILISVGKENRFGHPHQDVLDRIQRVLGESAQIMRTDVQGSIMYRCAYDHVCKIYTK